MSERGCRKSDFNPSNNNDEDSSEDENLQGALSIGPDIGVGPDIGLGDNSRLLRKSTMETQTGGSSNTDHPRREENPFSFKHFLNAPHGNGGARPKVASNPRLIANPELTSGLPDFVQDHLVIEQCYLSQQPQQPISVDIDHLAQLGLQSNNDSWNSGRSNELPFDLTATRHERLNEPLPRLPLDLPPGAEVGTSTSLPDFLSDGPIHSGRQHPSADDPPTTSSQPLTHLQMENEQLRRDLEILRRQLSEQLRRNESLEAELVSLRSRDSEDSATLERAVRQVEDNLLRAVKRAENAEKKSEKLKQQVKLLTLELREAGAPSGAELEQDGPSDRRLATELRAAVSTAEHSLRQMLSGVDTLRRIASTLENRHRLEPPESPEPDSDSGPAL